MKLARRIKSMTKQNQFDLTKDENAKKSDSASRVACGMNAAPDIGDVNSSSQAPSARSDRNGIGGALLYGSHAYSFEMGGNEANQQCRSSDHSDNMDNEKNTVFDEINNGHDFRIPFRLTKSGRKRATPFPIKLMKVLSDEKSEGIIGWTPSGQAFMIIKPSLFCEQILAFEFKSAKFTSFTRKLHRWGFVRRYKGPDAGAFYHKYFQKDRIDLVEKMTCQRPGETGETVASKCNGEDDDDDEACHPQPDLKDDQSQDSARKLAVTTPMSPSHEELSLARRKRADGTESTYPRQGEAGIISQKTKEPKSEDGLNVARLPKPQESGRHDELLVNMGGAGRQEECLNAAIEREVMRRLNERLHAAVALPRPLPTATFISLPPPPQQMFANYDHRNLFASTAPSSSTHATSIASNADGIVYLGRETSIIPPQFSTVQTFPTPNNYGYFSPSLGSLRTVLAPPIDGSFSSQIRVLTGESSLTPYEAIQFGIQLSDPNIPVVRLQNSFGSNSSNSFNFRRTAGTPP